MKTAISLSFIFIGGILFLTNCSNEGKEVIDSEETLKDGTISRDHTETASDIDTLDYMQNDTLIDEY